MFRIENLYGLPCVIVSPSGSEIFTTEVLSMPYLEHLEKFHLDICSPRYSHSPQVSCLWMNPGRGCNPDLEESYLPEYSESETETFTQGTSGIYLRSVNVSALEPSSILRYSKCTKMTGFILLGFSSPGPNQGLSFSKFYPTKNFDLGI